MKFLAAALVFGGMTAVTLGAADALSAAPAGMSPLEQTVETLEASGYHVIVDGAGIAQVIPHGHLDPDA